MYELLSNSSRLRVFSHLLLSKQSKFSPLKVDQKKTQFGTHFPLCSYFELIRKKTRFSFWSTSVLMGPQASFYSHYRSSGALGPFLLSFYSFSHFLTSGKVLLHRFFFTPTRHYTTILVKPPVFVFLKTGGIP